MTENKPKPAPTQSQLNIGSRHRNLEYNYFLNTLLYPSRRTSPEIPMQ
jgi:hypothetical protein